MNLSEIKKKYRQEWVLVEFDALDENLEIKEGHVLAHSPNREDVYKALSKTFGRNVSIEFVGSVPQDLTVMFFAQVRSTVFWGWTFSPLSRRGSIFKRATWKYRQEDTTQDLNAISANGGRSRKRGFTL